MSNHLYANAAGSHSRGQKRRFLTATSVVALGIVGFAVRQADASTVTLPFSDNFNSYSSSPNGSSSANGGPWYQSNNGSGVWSITSTGAVSGQGLNDTAANTSTNDVSTVQTGYSGNSANGFTESVDMHLNSLGTASSGSTRDGFFALSTTDDASSGDYYLADYWIVSGEGAIRIASTSGTFVDGTPSGNLTVTSGDTYLMTLAGTYATNGALTLTYTIEDLNTSSSVDVVGTDTSPSTGTTFGLRASTGTGGTQNTTFDNFSLTPEPSSLTLLGLGGLGVLAHRWRGA